MSNRYWQPPGLELAPRPSAHLRLVVLLVLALALVATWVSALHWPVASVLSLLLVLLSGVNCWRRGQHLAGRRIRRFFCEAGCWRLELDGEASLMSPEVVAFQPQQDSVVLPLLVVMRIREQAAARSGTLVLFADAFPAECWRRLQLNLRQTLSASAG